MKEFKDINGNELVDGKWYCGITGIEFQSCSDITVKGNTISNFMGQGIAFHTSVASYIYGNNLLPFNSNYQPTGYDLRIFYSNYGSNSIIRNNKVTIVGSYLVYSIVEVNNSTIDSNLINIGNNIISPF